MNTPSKLRAVTDRNASIDELDDAIGRLALQMNVINHDFLVLVRRFDERGGWLRSASLSCAKWLEWRCDLSASAARDRVRVAHAMKTLPAISLAFAKGKLSYSKVRALTRVAQADNEETLLNFALKTTAARVEERCRELRCGTVASTGDAARAHARRELRVRRNEASGTLTITVELPMETGELVDKALERAMEPALSGPEFQDESWGAQRADALVRMAQAYLGGDGDGAAGIADHYQVTVHVDEAALRGSADGRSGLPIETVRRIACDSKLIALVEDSQGNPLSVGRKTRVVPKALKRGLWARDRGCRFPGCSRTRFVDVHHVVHWAAGGETTLANTLLLCSEHHRLHHEGGFTIEKDYRGKWFFKRPDGRAVPACGYQAADVTDVDVGTLDEYFEAGASAEAFCGTAASAEASPRFAETWAVKEPSPEPYRCAEPYMSMRSPTANSLNHQQ